MSFFKMFLAFLAFLVLSINHKCCILIKILRRRLKMMLRQKPMIHDKSPSGVCLPFIIISMTTLVFTFLKDKCFVFQSTVFVDMVKSSGKRRREGEAREVGGGRRQILPTY